MPPFIGTLSYAALISQLNSTINKTKIPHLHGGIMTSFAAFFISFGPRRNDKGCYDKLV